ncbi:MAG TPA: hypothetical protein VHE32_08745, partial [Rhodanobacteraceae bacterium]|nr:hypothetical protein [Rhodanobacteraceae bacterium]
LTMSYQRLGAGVYVAESKDDGVTWDTLQTQIAADAQLPRIAYRESDGLYLATYQVGGSALKMYAKTTKDVRDWSAPPQDFAVAGNNHDSLPVVMPDGAFAVFWIRAAGNQFDIAVRRSPDGLAWSPPLAVTDTPGADDVEPHPLVGASSSSVELYWGRDEPVGSYTYDIVRETGVVIERLFAGGFEA